MRRACLSSSGRLAVRLSELLRANLSLVSAPGGAAPPEEDERLFAQTCVERCAHSARMISLLTMVGTLLWWPTDALIYGRARESLRAVTQERVTMLLAPLLVVLLLRLPRCAARAPLVLALGLAACCASLGYGAGCMGQLDEPWFHLLHVTLFIPVLMPLALGPRVWHTLVIPASLWLGLLLPFPQNLASRYLPLSLSVQVALLLLSVVFGHGLYLLNRQGFLQSRIIHRDAELLKGYSAELERRVRARTAELRRLLAQVETAREEERTRISRDLHDELGQELTVLGYEVEVLQRRCAADAGGLAQPLEDLAAHLQAARRTLRALVTELRPRVLDDLGLCAAVEWLAQRTEERGELRCDLTLLGEELEVPEEVAIAAFRVVQESLTNALRHAAARAVVVRVEITPQQVLLQIRDDGRGVEAQALARSGGVGLLGMRERATRLKGSLTIESSPGSGLLVRCALPLAATSEPAAGAAG